MFKTVTGRSGGAVYFGSSRRHQFPLHAATHHDSKSLSPFSGIRLPAGPLQFDYKRIEVTVRTAQTFGCGLLALPSICPPDTINSPSAVLNAFLSGDFWFFCFTPCGVSIAGAANPWKFRGETVSARSPARTCCFWPAGRAGFRGRKRPKRFALHGKRFSTPSNMSSPSDWSNRVLGQIDTIGVDEIQYSKGPKYLTLVYQFDLGVTRLLWVGKERTIESFQGFFTVIGDEIASKIAFVCSGMWEPYLKVIREKCSEAIHILDRFHIVAKMNKALDEVRAGESRRMAREGLMPVLKKSRWLLLKREENLKTAQRCRLRDLLRYNLKTVRAYLLKEAFQQRWDYDSPTWAGEFLDQWCRQVMCSRIEAMKKIARSMREHRELILNYFRGQRCFPAALWKD
jgi:transposase